jgi:anti-sigma regulatory factor (Ser/Thr protein kinase)
MAMTAAFPVGDASAAAEARRTAETRAVEAGFDATRTGQLAIVVMELATNILKHGEQGEILITECHDGARRGIEVLALDKGHGLANLEDSVRDGRSTSGSLGQGLGAIQRLSDVFDVFSQPSRGTAALARLWSKQNGNRGAESLSLGVVNVAKSGEAVSGDAWSARINPYGAVMIVADGLGHGVLAAEASAAAVSEFERDPMRAPSQSLEDVHRALRPTRGAAVAIASLDFEHDVARFAGLGNIAGVILDGTTRRSLVSHNGTAGHTARQMTEFNYPLLRSSILVMHSDGLGSAWSANDYAGLLHRDPSLVAGVLYRDFTRRRDDVTVLVARRNR